jgi:hypothetical protein
VSSPIILLFAGQAAPPGYVLIGQFDGALHPIVQQTGHTVIPRGPTDGDRDHDRHITILLYEKP